MIESDWQIPYEPQRATNRQLADDWRLFIAAIANIEQGRSEPFTEKRSLRMGASVHPGDRTSSEERQDAVPTL
jgi:hypothetical protein